VPCRIFRESGRQRLPYYAPAPNPTNIGSRYGAADREKVRGFLTLVHLDFLQEHAPSVPAAKSRRPCRPRRRANVADGRRNRARVNHRSCFPGGIGPCSFERGSGIRTVVQVFNRARIRIGPAVEVFFRMRRDCAELRLLSAGGDDDLVKIEERVIALTLGIDHHQLLPQDRQHDRLRKSFPAAVLRLLLASSLSGLGPTGCLLKPAVLIFAKKDMAIDAIVSNSQWDGAETYKY